MTREPPSLGQCHKELKFFASDSELLTAAQALKVVDFSTQPEPLWAQAREAGREPGISTGTIKA